MVFRRQRRGLARLLRRFGRGDKGVVAVEMAMAMPVILALILSGIEVTRYVLLNQKVERAAATMADLTSQSPVMTEAEIQGLFFATSNVLTPYDLAADGRVIVSSIARSGGGDATIRWQRAFGAGGGASTYGLEGAVANLPVGFVVRDGENVIVTEVFYDFQPILVGTVLAAGPIYSAALFRPRFGSLASIQP